MAKVDGFRSISVTAFFFNWGVFMCRGNDWLFFGSPNSVYPCGFSVFPAAVALGNPFTLALFSSLAVQNLFDIVEYVIIMIGTCMRSVSRVVLSRRKLSVESQKDLCCKLAFIGGGQMGEAILNALIKDCVQCTTKIHMYDVNPDRIKYLVGKYGIVAEKTVQECVDGADIVVVAVKPQNIDTLSLSLVTPPKGMILSIVAGCPISTLSSKFKTDKVMRTMPNTPAMISEGITVWTATKETPKELRDKGEKLLSSIGDQIEVSDEKYLDMATAISGSGPAVSDITTVGPSQYTYPT